VLDADDLLVAIRIPHTWADADFYFEKAADRNSWDFALVSVAAAFRMNGATVEAARLVIGAVQCVPRRLEPVEVMLRGKARTEVVAEAAGRRSIDRAEPLSFNHFKIPLMENLVKRAVRGDPT